MAVYFRDSSAGVKRYIFGTGTPWVRGLADPRTGNRIYVARISGAEVVAALARRARGGGLAPAAAAAAIARFRYHLTSEYRILEVDATIVARAMDLAQAHSLRGYDA